MTIAKSIIQNMSGKMISGVRINDTGLTTIEFKTGDKVVFNVNLSKGVDYQSPKEKPNLKVERTTKHAEKELEGVSKPKNKKIKVKIKKQGEPNDG